MSNDLSDAMKARLEKWRNKSSSPDLEKRGTKSANTYMKRREYGDVTETDLRIEEEKAHG